MAEIMNPYKKYNYKVLIDGNEEAGFSEVSAPDITSDPVEYRGGNMAGKTPGKQPGILKYSNVTLKRGTTESQGFVDWMKEIQNGKAPRNGGHYPDGRRNARGCLLAAGKSLAHQVQRPRLQRHQQRGGHREPGTGLRGHHPHQVRRNRYGIADRTINKADKPRIQVTCCHCGHPFAHALNFERVV